MPTPTEQAEVRIVARLTAQPGRADPLREELLAMLAPSRAEAGCLLYELHEDLETPGQFTFIERWRDAGAFEFHRATPHFRRFGPAVADLIVPPLAVSKLRVIG